MTTENERLAESAFPDESKRAARADAARAGHATYLARLRARHVAGEPLAQYELMRLGLIDKKEARRARRRARVPADHDRSLAARNGHAHYVARLQARMRAGETLTVYEMERLKTADRHGCRTCLAREEAFHAARLKHACKHSDSDA